MIREVRVSGPRAATHSGVGDLSERRTVFHHGYKGPKEIGCSDKFARWLTDPAANGGGAVVDFGCDGAVLTDPGATAVIQASRA